jgi:aspartate/methionine/tyrosine aminotransferase
MPAEQFCCRLAKEAHVLFNPSEMYGGEHYVRINLATSREVLSEAMNRLKKFIAEL